MQAFSSMAVDFTVAWVSNFYHTIKWMLNSRGLVDNRFILHLTIFEYAT